MNAIEFGKFLASIRNEKKLTQEELAEKLFIDKRKISRWECGMSIPDLETVAKLCEILDVTPYEFITCKKIENEKLTKRIINKFKSIKDFKKYTFKKKILRILSVLLGLIFIFTTIYTIMYYGEVEIYEFRSLDEDYGLIGTYIHTKNYSIYSINDICFKNDVEKLINNFDSCEYGIYYNDIRISKFKEKNEKNNTKDTNDFKVLYYENVPMNQYINKTLTIKISCINKYRNDEYSIDFKFIKEYDNKLF